jgi:hypothetical protein
MITPLVICIEVYMVLLLPNTYRFQQVQDFGLGMTLANFQIDGKSPVFPNVIN